MWLRFDARFDWSPAALRGRVTISHPAGLVRFVTRECAARALASGKARPCRRDGSVLEAVAPDE